MYLFLHIFVLIFECIIDFIGYSLNFLFIGFNLHILTTSYSKKKSYILCNITMIVIFVNVNILPIEMKNVTIYFSYLDFVDKQITNTCRTYLKKNPRFNLIQK